ncbi:MAG: IclR family transcriptional regulator [Candidatus Phosphoribacter sp.]|nr:IclR family transcriptional regulator [Actinomycetales bacterium]
MRTNYLESVDNSLRLLMLIAAKARVGVSEVAAELGVAPSTAYRLLSTLRYRGFVVQGNDRTYRAGPALEEMVSSRMSRTSLADLAAPALTTLRDVTEETCHLMVLVGRQMRFIASVESFQSLRIGSRTGAMLPAHRTSGGKSILAALPEQTLDRLYPLTGIPDGELTAAAVATLRRELARVRKLGYAVNNGQTERGVAAVGVAVCDGDGPIAALSVSLPTARYHAELLPGFVAAMNGAAAEITAALRP